MPLLERSLSTAGPIRELARNMERVVDGTTEQVCLSERGRRAACACYRDANHIGRHRCLCGVEWSSPSSSYSRPHPQRR